MVIGEAIGTTDVAIIGAGPGGYVAALLLAQHGKKVTLIDRESVGGVCLHHGCIPTKTLIRAAEMYESLSQGKEMGIYCDNPRYDFNQVQNWKRTVVQKLDQSIRALLEKRNVQLIHANAFFEENNKLMLTPVNENEHLEINALEFRHCILATGSREREVPGISIDRNKIITSSEAIEFTQLPSSVLVIGGGYIGIELSQMLSKFGVQVTLLESLPNILNLLDHDINQIVQQKLEAHKVKVYTNVQIQQVAVGEKVKTTFQYNAKTHEVETDKVLVAIGRVPHTEELRLQNTHVKTDDRGFIRVKSNYATDDPHIYAIGDVVGGVMLANKAMAEAKVAVDAILGKPAAFDNLIPYAIFSDPEIAGVGLTETEALQKKIPYKIHKLSYHAISKSLILNGDGFYKVLFDDEKNILGLHIVGPRASDLIGVGELAMEMGATLEDLSLLIHPHPTLVEGYAELAQAVLGFPINSL